MEITQFNKIRGLDSVVLKRAESKDRFKIAKLHFQNHLITTTRNRSEKNLQIHTLFSDFPHLMSDSEFNKTMMWVAVFEDNIIGCIAFIPEKKQISTFSVSPLYRGQGIGKKLLQTTLDYVKKNNYNQVHLYTLPDRHTSAHQMYVKLGFQTTKTIIRGPFVLHFMILNLS